MASNSIVKKSASREIVFDYHPQEFPVMVSQSASEFMSQQNYQKSDFKISDLVAQQSGINELQRRTLEEKTEAMALERLKSIEEKAYREAYDLGLIEGNERAFADSKQEIENRLDKLDQLLKQVENLKKSLVVENEGAFIQLLYHVARCIALKEVKESPDLIKDILTQLVEGIQGDEKIVVHLSSEDYQFIEQVKAKMNREAEPLRRVKCEVNENLQSGGCVIDTNYGSIDATIQERVNKAWEVLQSRIPQVKRSGDGEPTA